MTLCPPLLFQFLHLRLPLRWYCYFGQYAAGDHRIAPWLAHMSVSTTRHRPPTRLRYLWHRSVLVPHYFWSMGTQVPCWMPILAIGKCLPGAVGTRVCVRYSVLQNRTFVIDQSSGVSFLVDSGASVSVIPVSLVHPRSRSPPLPELALRTANDSVISVYGLHSVSLDLGFGHLFHWVFLLANIQQAILGADFLSRFALLVDCTYHHLLDSSRHTMCTLYASCSDTDWSSMSGLSFPSPPQADAPILHLLSSFPALTQTFRCHEVQHSVTHSIQITGLHGLDGSVQISCLLLEFRIRSAWFSFFSEFFFFVVYYVLRNRFCSFVNAVLLCSLIGKHLFVILLFMLDISLLLI